MSRDISNESKDENNSLQFKFGTLLNIYDGVFFKKNNEQLLAVKCFRKNAPLSIFGSILNTLLTFYAMSGSNSVCYNSIIEELACYTKRLHKVSVKM